LINLLSALVEPPDVEDVLFTDRHEHLVVTGFMDLNHCLPVDGEPSKDMVKVVHFDEEDRPLAQTDHDKLIEPLAVRVLDEAVLGVDGLAVFIQVGEDLAVVLRWLCEAVGDASNALGEALSFIVF